MWTLHLVMGTSILESQHLVLLFTHILNHLHTQYQLNELETHAYNTQS